MMASCNRSKQQRLRRRITNKVQAVAPLKQTAGKVAGKQMGSYKMHLWDTFGSNQLCKWLLLRLQHIDRVKKRKEKI